MAASCSSNPGHMQQPSRDRMGMFGSSIFAFLGLPDKVVGLSDLEVDMLHESLKQRASHLTKVLSFCSVNKCIHGLNEFRTFLACRQHI